MPSKTLTAPEARPWMRRLGRVARMGSFRFALFSALSALAVLPMLSHAGAMNPFRDAQVLAHYEEAARQSVLAFHQLPLWDPYYCGGLYLWGAPQARFASPSFLLSLLFGTLRAEGLIAFAFLLLALEGTYRYARARGASTSAALLAAPIFGLSGVFACSPSLGWINFYSFALVPWALWGARLAARGERRGFAIGALAFATMAGMGGTYTVPLTALFCPFEVMEVFLRARRAAVLGRGLAFAALAVGLSAFRLWPIAETLWTAPRIVSGMSCNTGDTLGRMLFSGIPDPGHPEWYFIGALALPAMALGATRRRAWLLTALVVTSVWLAAGYCVHPSLFGLLRRLPLYATLRYPERFLVLTGLFASALAAQGVDRALRLKRPHRDRTWAAVAIALLINPVFLLNNFHESAAGRDWATPPDAPAALGDFRQARGNRWALMQFLPIDRGSLQCWEAYPVPQSALLRSDLTAEEYLADPTAGIVTRQSWSPNRIALQAELWRPGRIRINQNFHRGWRTDVGQVVSDDGLLAVDLPAGRQKVVLSFIPRSAVGGGLMSVTTLLVLLVLGRWRSPAAWLATLAPFVVGGCAALTFHEAPPVAPSATLGSGEAIVADHPPAGVTAIGAQLEEGIWLDAARARWVPTTEGHALELELDWRVTEAPEKGLGVFVHVESPGTENRMADHPQISDALTFADAPLQKTLRDVVHIDVPHALEKKPWRIFAGVWATQGDGHRLKIIQPGAATTNENRALVFEGTPPDRAAR